MQNWPLTVPSILAHCERFHGTQTLVSRTVEGPVHVCTYADMAVRSRRVSSLFFVRCQEKSAHRTLSEQHGSMQEAGARSQAARHEVRAVFPSLSCSERNNSFGLDLSSLRFSNAGPETLLQRWHGIRTGCDTAFLASPFASLCLFVQLYESEQLSLISCYAAYGGLVCDHGGGGYLSYPQPTPLY